MKQFQALIVLLLAFACQIASGNDVSSTNWPSWRGPLNNGVSPSGKPPTQWSEKQNIKWKVAIPGEGFSTPIIWNEKIFLLTAINTGKPGAQLEAFREFAEFAKTPAPTEEYRFDVICLNRATGKKLWSETPIQTVPNEGKHPSHTYASASPVTDGENLYVSFGSQGIYCVSLKGGLIWRRDLGKMETRYSWGEGASPAIHGDTLIVNWDHEGPSFITALNKQTGATLWKTERDERSSWSTPLIVEHDGGAQVIVAATRRVSSYDLATGKLIWECGGQHFNVIASPVTANGVVYATSSYGKSAVTAMRLGGKGDITGTGHVAWNNSRIGSYVPSPLLHKDRLYLLSRMNGILSCLDAATGKPHYQSERLEGIGGLYTSPVAANGHVYITGRDGKFAVLKDGDELNVIATNELNDKFDASPAIAGNEIFLRGHKNLYCIAE